MTARSCCFVLLLLATLAAAQQTTKQTETPEEPAANPGRPTVSTPAALTPVGYLQFETGAVGATDSPGLNSQVSFNEVIKYSVARRLELLVASEPYAHSDAPGQPASAAGDVDLGVQAVLHEGEGLNPTVGLSYFGRAYAGAAPDLDIASFKNRALVLISGDIKRIHIDTNYLFDELIDGNLRRAAFGQTFSASGTLPHNFGWTGEIWHFTQPFLRSNAVGNLWAITYSPRKTLVLDIGFQHGLTSTSTQWETFAGFTYLLPRRLPHWRE